MKSIGRIARKTIGGMISGLSLLVATPLSATARQPLPAPWTGTIAHVTDGDTFRLADGTRIRIADIDSAETQKRQAKCAGEIAIGLRQKRDATALLDGVTVEVRPVGRSYARIVARIGWRGRDLGGELVRRGLAKPWKRGQPKPDLCAPRR
nr:thermonuclease family protein [Sphingomonas sp. Y57]